MVINILVEGGAPDDDKNSVATLDNSESLRRAFQKLFASGITSTDIKIVVQTGGSWTGAVSKFKATANSILLIDLEGPKNRIPEKLEQAQITECRDKSFFMIQSMEGWILSQPDKIEECFAHLKRKAQSPLTEDPSIKGKNPEEIAYPARVLQTLLGRYFIDNRYSIPKKLKYGKLKNAPQLIGSLDINRLCKTFDEANSMIHKINSF